MFTSFILLPALLTQALVTLGGAVVLVIVTRRDRPRPGPRLAVAALGAWALALAAQLAVAALTVRLEADLLYLAIWPLTGAAWLAGARFARSSWRGSAAVAWIAALAAWLVETWVVPFTLF